MAVAISRDLGRVVNFQTIIVHLNLKKPTVFKIFGRLLPFFAEFFGQGPNMANQVNHKMRKILFSECIYRHIFLPRFKEHVNIV